MTEKLRKARDTAMWTPGRAIAAGLAGGLLTLGGCSQGAPGPAAATPSEQVTPAASASPSGEPGGHDDHNHTPAPAAPGRQAAATAEAFARAWVRRDLDAERWWKAIAPLCEEGFGQRLRTVDPANVPATRVIGRARELRVGSVDSPAVYDVPTDAGTLRVTLASVDGRWLVAGNDFRRAASR